jgi:hypothetical protein
MYLEWPNWIWAASLDLNSFKDFMKLFVNMRLTISFVGVQISYFLNLWIKSYGCLKILGEVWAGWACFGANQQELTTCAKICGQEEGVKIWKGLVWSTCVRPPAVARRPRLAI